MNKSSFRVAGWLFLLPALVLAGCQTGSNNTKTCGVYTTLAVTGHDLDLPGGQRVQKDSFGPDEAPAAVVVGYGNADHDKRMTLQLVEMGTARCLASNDFSTSINMGVVMRLPVRLSGKYKVRLLADGTEYDSCLFTVMRTNKSGAALAMDANPAAAYADGVFSISMPSEDSPGLFSTYDDGLMQTIMYNIRKDAEDNHPDLFAQRAPGKVVIGCNLDSQGRLTDPKVLENTLDDDCAGAFQKVLKDGSPYRAWPEDARRKFGYDRRGMAISIALE